MSAYFPRVNLPELRTFVIEAAIGMDLNVALVANPGMDCKKHDFTQPVVTSIADVVWAGEKMIEISFEPSSVRNGPRSLLAYFPRGRPRLTTQAYVGMATMAHRAGVRVARPIIFNEDPSNPIGAEVILLEKPPGESLDILWPSLSNKQQKAVCRKLTEDLLKLFNCRSRTIHTHRICTNLDREEDSRLYISDDSLLIHPSFDHGPLVVANPPEAMHTVEDYLTALVQRVYRVLDNPKSVSYTIDPFMIDLGKQALDSRDTELIRDTWKRLEQLIPYHVGGFYIPTQLLARARAEAMSVLRDPSQGIYHHDLQMHRIIVDFDGKEPEISITGWDHAYFAPLWSCARMPPWVMPGPSTDAPEPVDEEQKAKMRRLIFCTMKNDLRESQSGKWIDALVFGEMERIFEACLSDHWMDRDVVEEYGLMRIKDYWDAWRPRVPFPVTATWDFERMLDPNVLPFLAHIENEEEIEQAASAVPVFIAVNVEQLRVLRALREPESDTDSVTLASSSDDESMTAVQSSDSQKHLLLKVDGTDSNGQALEMEGVAQLRKSVLHKVAQAFRAIGAFSNKYKGEYRRLD
ncbi:hypothetical protein AcW1_004477 [Taiwanofungus camphoratus]|nr:hypothetical protein AcW2_006518 [Antrodia cinnamomea]KAI0939429.1 hypothetical protein AcV5_000852 [Antrodia cinnamomea]KAI0952355.1 hypothetical protein AcV7_008193 [Antrodia cinnamomea]KAI0959737.1 hypothetical protein AcW1_004477 [Antrodia cinnamomea]